MSKYSGYIGIDLGTTNCVVSAINDNGDIDIVQNLDGETITPSFIHLVEDASGKITTTIGKKAKEQMKVDPKNVLSSYKTYMGTPTVLKKIFNKSVNSLQCSALMLKYLKASAESALGQTVTGAVISVPAYFSEPQKEATKIAAKLAGLEVKRILTEPTAGAFYYGVNSDQDETVVAVYDIGGGTFDVSIISILEETSTVLGIGGDSKLGGDDVDELIARYVLKENNKKKLVESDMEKLIRYSEMAKIKLCELIEKKTSNPTVTIECEDLKLKPVELTKETFDAIIDPMIERTLTCFDTALEHAMLSKDDLDEIVLIGGSSRIPYIREKLTEYLNRKDKFNEKYFSSYTVDPDLAVGLGCGIYLKYILDNKENNLTDIVTKTISVEDELGYSNPIIRKGKVLPAKGSKTFTNSYDNQTSVDIKIYEGSEKIAVNNTLLGTVQIPIKPAPKNTEQVLVRAKLTHDGTVDVEVISGLNTKKLTIKRDFNENDDIDWVDRETSTSSEETGVKSW